jgi:hypothetical protein
MAVVFAFPEFLSRRHPFGVEVEVLRHSPGDVVDGYEEQDTWSTALFARGCVVAPGAVSEDFEPNRDGVGVDFTVYFPPGVSVGPRDRVVLPGHEEPFEVKGQPQDWGRNPFSGSSSGVVVQVGRFDG